MTFREERRDMGAVSGRINWQADQIDLTAITNEQVEAGAGPPIIRSTDSAALAFQATVPAAGEVGSLVHDSAARLTITADARLDERDTLCDQLSITRDQQGLISDTELILRAYQKWGFDCPDYLLGDFSFAVWDESRQQLFAARDFAGVRPFYYHHDDRQFVFASDLPAVAACDGVPRKLNEDHFSRAVFQHNTACAVDETAYATIRRLPPGHSLVVDRNGLRTMTWWSPQQVESVHYRRDVDYAEHLHHLLHDAVHCRLEGPVATHISGCMNSSAISIIAGRRLQDCGRTLSAIHGLQQAAPDLLVQDDERQRAASLCEQNGLGCHYAPAMNVFDAARVRIRHVGDRPPGLLLREQCVRRTAVGLGSHVLLSGLGSRGLIGLAGCFDEELRRGNLWGFWKGLQQYARPRNGSTLGVLVSKSDLGRLPRKWRKMWRNGMRLPERPAAANGRASRQAWQSDFLAELSPVEASPAPLVSYRNVLSANARSSVRPSQYHRIAGGELAHALEGWAAAGRMAQIEYRYPMLDRRVVEFALGVPGNLFLHNGHMRWLLRESLGGVLPDSVRWKASGKPALELDRQRINREFDRDLVRPLLKELLSEDWQWRCLSPEGVRRLMTSTDKASSRNANMWPAPIAALRMEMFFNQDLYHSVIERLRDWEASSVSAGTKRADAA